MGAGILLLVSRGHQHKYLVDNPEVTYFKTVHRRHTNFSIESVKQNFNEAPDFGKSSTCNISHIGDLINKSYLIIDLPSIEKFYNNRNEIDKIKKFAWVKNIGYAILKEVSIQFDDRIIDRQYGEWLLIWNQYSKTNNIDVMMGNVPQLYEPTNGKNNYTLYIPLRFWFCNYSTLSLPIVALKKTTIKINIKLRNLYECCNIYPSNSIIVSDVMVPYTPGELITQKVNGVTSRGYYYDFDYLENRMYYMKVSETNFQTPNTQNEMDDYVITNNLGYESTPSINRDNYVEKNLLNNKNLINCYLYVDYIYIDKAERRKFLTAFHEYLIEQVQYVEKILVSGNNIDINLSFINPVKSIYWVVQPDNNIIKSGYKDWFDYTDNGIDLVKYSKLLLDDINVNTELSGIYTGIANPYKYHTKIPNKKINMYSFSLNPEDIQPSGTLNFSYLKNSKLRIKLNVDTNKFNNVKIRVYALNYNILKIFSDVGFLNF